MDYRDQVHKILEEAEESLRALVTSAAAKGEYDAIVELARTARAIEALRVPGPEVSSETVTAKLAANGALSKPSLQAGRKTYPQFFRADEFLVKVGWSKRHRAEYEHRAPRPVLVALVSALEKRGKHTTRFSSDDIFPLRDSRDDDIPGYQGYVCLAWLAFIGAVERQGRQGYRIVAKRPLRDLVEEQWTAVPER